MRLGRTALLGGLLAPICVLVIACGGAHVGQAAATQIATQFLVQGEPVGVTVSDVTVRSVQELDSAWRVTLDGQVVYPPAGGTPHAPTQVHEVIDVDKQTGVPSLAAQG